MSAEDRLKELGIQLPAVATPVANYVPAKRVDTRARPWAWPSSRAQSRSRSR